MPKPSQPEPVRIIPCLDMKDGRVIKGIEFVNLRDAGDPIEIALAYEREGADELVILDIAATNEGRATRKDIVTQIAQTISIPLTVGGGISSLSDMSELFSVGVSRCSLGSAALANPQLINDAAEKYGANSIVVAIDAKATQSGPQSWEVMTRGGTQATGVDAVDWARECEQRGAGQLLVTSMNEDGVQSGYDLELTHTIASAVNIPVIASGGAGKLSHFAEAVTQGGASAVLAASVFHFGTLTISEVKEYLAEQDIPVLLDGRSKE